MIGHEVTHVTLRANVNLYSGVRNNKVFFNSAYLFLNYLKKGNFLKKLSETESQIIFTTARLEFFRFIQQFALRSGADYVEFNKYMDLTKTINNINGEFLQESYLSCYSKSDPILILLNNDNLGSKGIMKEISNKNYFTISIADSNSLNTTANGFIPLYGSDDSARALSFYGKFICNCLAKGTYKKQPYGGAVGQKKKCYEKENLCLMITSFLLLIIL